jgi:hypothetical protein
MTVSGGWWLVYIRTPTISGNLRTSKAHLICAQPSVWFGVSGLSHVLLNESAIPFPTSYTLDVAGIWLTMNAAPRSW